jgi:hypothetical protein
MSQRVDNLALSKVAIWNRGKDTINAEDVAPIDPLRITIGEEHRLLSAEITFRTTGANNSSIDLRVDKREESISTTFTRMKALSCISTTRGGTMMILGFMEL